MDPIEKYYATHKDDLDVLEPDLMPVPGRSLHLGLVQAEEALGGANVLVRQIVLMSEAPTPPSPVAIPGSETLRSVVALDGRRADWADFSDSYGAELWGMDDGADGTIRRLEDAVRAAAHASVPSSRLELTPFLIAGAMLLWLTLFRRRIG